MANKITKRQIINMMMDEEVIMANPTYMAYLENEIALLNKKAQNKKPTKTQAENEELKEIILETLESIGEASVSELQASNIILGSKTNQKITSLLRQLKEEKKINRSMDKKRAVFSLRDGSEEDVEE